MGTVAPFMSDLQTVDYDLHGLAGVRLLDAAPGDAKAVDRQLGPIRGPLQREPDLVCASSTASTSAAP